MGNDESPTTVRLSPADLVGFLGDVENLPRCLPSLTVAHRGSGDLVDVTAHIDPPNGPARDVHGQAWIKVKTAGRTLAWGAPGSHDYHGELDVDAGSAPDTATVTIHIHTEHVDDPQLQRRCVQTLEGIRRNVEKAAR